MDNKEYQRKYRELNKKELKDYQREWYQENKERLKAKSKKYYQENKEEIKAKSSMKYNMDVNYKIKKNVHKAIANGIKNKYFEERLEYMLGYSFNELKLRLEKNFQDGMSWDNFGKWQIYHVVPVHVYNFYNENEIKKCWDLDNLFPMWIENIDYNLDLRQIEFMELGHLLPETILFEDFYEI